MTSATAEIDAHREGDQGDAGETDNRPAYDDINTPVILMVGAISAIVTLCTIFFVQGLCYQWQNSYIRERSYDDVNEPVLSIVDGQKAMLAGDQEKGIRPVSETMTEVINQYGGKPSATSQQ